MNNNNNNNGKITVKYIIKHFKGKDAIIFCRVSTPQQAGMGNMSFSVQESKGFECCRILKLVCRSVIKTVESAYTGKPTTMFKLLSKRGKCIVIYDVSRFCRRVGHGKELLRKALKNNVTLFFVSEGLIYGNNFEKSEKLILDKLRIAEEESKAIGRRVSHALREKKRRGFYTGGTVPYGKKVVNVQGGKKLVDEEHESNVIRFITGCVELGTSAIYLSRLMKLISGYDEPIILEHNGVKVIKLKEPLTYSTIASLLNEYEVYKRGRKWTASSVSRILKTQMDNLYDDVANNMETMNMEMERWEQ